MSIEDRWILAGWMLPDHREAGSTECQLIPYPSICYPNPALPESSCGDSRGIRRSPSRPLKAYADGNAPAISQMPTPLLLFPGHRQILEIDPKSSGQRACASIGLPCLRQQQDRPVQRLHTGQQQLIGLDASQIPRLGSRLPGGIFGA
jgi:hypothetical protein